MWLCVSSFAPEWAGLRDNLTPSAARPTAFDASVLSFFWATDLPPGFTYTSRAFYKVLLANFCTIPIFPALWSGFVPSRFSLSRHWGLIRDSFTENYKNDLAWLITLRAVKVRHSLHTWGYIRSPRCALCARLKTIDHCYHCCWYLVLSLCYLRFCQPPSFPIAPSCFFTNSCCPKGSACVCFCTSSSPFCAVFGNFVIRLPFTRVGRTLELSLS